MGQRQRRRYTRRGLTLVELAVGMAVLTVGVLSFIQVLVASNRAEAKNRELARAASAARQTLESIDAEAFADAFRRFNDTGADDPGGANTAPGKHFAVEGLSALPSDADGFPGEVIFPSPTNAPNQLREDFASAELGMPRDLNGDNVIDAANHATDYWMLPVIVRVRWRSASGPGEYEIKSVIGNY